MRRLPQALAALGCCLALVLGACGGAASTQSGTAATASREESAPRPARLTRPEVACRLHSCAPPYYCNQDTGLCERLPCLESADCPFGYKCDFSENLCQ